MTNIANDKIIDRIRKLFALAEKAGTMEEAGTATALAQKLIAEHALSEEQVRQARSRETGRVADEPIVSRITYVSNGTKTPTWISILSNYMEIAAAERDTANEAARQITAIALRTLDARKEVAKAECQREIGKIRGGRTVSHNTDYGALQAGRRAGASVNISRTRAIG